MHKASGKDLFAAVSLDPDRHDITAHAVGFAHKQIVMWMNTPVTKHWQEPSIMPTPLISPMKNRKQTTLYQ